MQRKQASPKKRVPPQRGNTLDARTTTPRSADYAERSSASLEQRSSSMWATNRAAEPTSRGLQDQSHDSAKPGKRHVDQGRCDEVGRHRTLSGEDGSFVPRRGKPVRKLNRVELSQTSGRASRDDERSAFRRRGQAWRRFESRPPPFLSPLGLLRTAGADTGFPIVRGARPRCDLDRARARRLPLGTAATATVHCASNHSAPHARDPRTCAEIGRSAQGL